MEEFSGLVREEHSAAYRGCQRRASALLRFTGKKKAILMRRIAKRVWLGVVVRHTL